LANRLWGQDGAVYVSKEPSRLFLVQFPSEEVCDLVLRSGPWHIRSTPLHFRVWDFDAQPIKLSPTMKSTWVTFTDVPAPLFTKKGVSSLASTLGIPISTDLFTYTYSGCRTAKACVIIDGVASKPDSIQLALGGRPMVSIHVSYHVQSHERRVIQGPGGRGTCN
ncbi:hypothetical protein LINPERHAP1_LOCUS21491, partial [Linum perenne]